MCEFGTDKATCPNCPETCQGQEERDYQKDLEVCEKATPGPWETKAITETSGPMKITIVRAWEIHGFGEDGSLIMDWVDKKEDADLTVLARTALPWYIKRCMELESQLQQSHEREAALRETLESVKESMLSECSNLVAMSVHWVLDFRQLIKSFPPPPSQPSRYREMEKVVEALKELTQACKRLPASDGRAIGLIPIIDRAENTLTAYDKAGEGAV